MDTLLAARLREPEKKGSNDLWDAVLYKKLGDTDQKKTNDIRTRRKAELGA